jgi:hypothetical protein
MHAYFFGEEITSQNEMGGSGNDENKEDNVGISVQKVTLNMFSIHLANVERLKTTLSSLTYDCMKALIFACNLGYCLVY